MSKRSRHYPPSRAQNDPVKWLQDELQLRFPDDADVMEITLRSAHSDDAAKILDALVAAIFQLAAENEQRQSESVSKAAAEEPGKAAEEAKSSSTPVDAAVIEAAKAGYEARGS